MYPTSQKVTLVKVLIQSNGWLRDFIWPLYFVNVPVVYNTGLCERLRFQKNLGLLILSMCLSCIMQGWQEYASGGVLFQALGLPLNATSRSVLHVSVYSLSYVCCVFVCAEICSDMATHN